MKIHLGYVAVLAGAILMPGCATATATPAEPSPAVQASDAASHETETERNRRIITDFAGIFYGERDVRRAMMTYVVPDYIQHNPEILDGRDAALASLEGVFGIPGGHFDVKRIVVDGDIAVVHLLGAPDPAHPALALFDMYRLKDGKIVEHWDVGRPITPGSINPHPFF